MGITLEEINRTNICNIGTCDGSFTIDAKLVLHAENGDIRYTIVDVPSTTKHYGKDDIDYTMSEKMQGMFVGAALNF